MVDGRRIVGWSAALAVALAAAAAAVAGATDAVTRDEALDKLFDSLVTLAGAVVLTGIIGVMVDRANREREHRDNARSQRLELVRRLRTIHSDVKQAALLIATHRTARTYGEQMRALLASRVEVGAVRFEILHDGELTAETKKDMLEDLGAVARYLEALTDEYRDQYPRVSAIQRATHEWELQQARKLAARDRPPSPEDVVGSLVAWQELTRREAFPNLGILLASLEEHEPKSDERLAHEQQFSDPMKRLSDALTG